MTWLGLTRPRPVFDPRRALDWLDANYRNRHLGQRCLIIGGGPSAGTAVLDELADTAVIGTNIACFSKHFAALTDAFVAGFILDEGLLLPHLRECAALPFPVFTGNSVDDSDAVLRVLRAANVLRIPSNHTEGLGDSFHSFGNGGNSGFSAIQLAVLLGFRVIGLLGFDGTALGRLHFHDEYPPRTHPEAFDAWRDNLNAYAPLFDLLGVRLITVGGNPQLAAYAHCSAAEFARLPLQAPPRSTDVALEQLLLPYQRGARLPIYGYYGAPRACFGGAVNTAMPNRYRPVPTSLKLVEVRGVDRPGCGDRWDPEA